MKFVNILEFINVPIAKPGILGSIELFVLLLNYG